MVRRRSRSSKRSVNRPLSSHEIETQRSIEGLSQNLAQADFRSTDADVGSRQRQADDRSGSHARDARDARDASHASSAAEAEDGKPSGLAVEGGFNTPTFFNGSSDNRFMNADGSFSVSLMGRRPSSVSADDWQCKRCNYEKNRQTASRCKVCNSSYSFDKLGCTVAETPSGTDTATTALPKSEPSTPAGTTATPSAKSAVGTSASTTAAVSVKPIVFNSSPVIPGYNIFSPSNEKPAQHQQHSGTTLQPPPRNNQPPPMNIYRYVASLSDAKYVPRPSITDAPVPSPVIAPKRKSIESIEDVMKAYWKPAASPYVWRADTHEAAPGSSSASKSAKESKACTSVVAPATGQFASLVAPASCQSAPTGVTKEEPGKTPDKNSTPTQASGNAPVNESPANQPTSRTSQPFDTADNDEPTSDDDDGTPGRTRRYRIRRQYQKILHKRRKNIKSVIGHDWEIVDSLSFLNADTSLYNQEPPFKFRNRSESTKQEPESLQAQNPSSPWDSIQAMDQPTEGKAPAQKALAQKAPAQKALAQKAPAQKAPPAQLLGGCSTLNQPLKTAPNQQGAQLPADGTNNTPRLPNNEADAAGTASSAADASKEAQEYGHIIEANPEGTPQPTGPTTESSVEAEGGYLHKTASMQGIRNQVVQQAVLAQGEFSRAMQCMEQMMIERRSQREAMEKMRMEMLMMEQAFVRRMELERDSSSRQMLMRDASAEQLMRQTAGTAGEDDLAVRSRQISRDPLASEGAAATRADCSAVASPGAATALTSSALDQLLVDVRRGAVGAEEEEEQVINVLSCNDSGESGSTLGYVEDRIGDRIGDSIGGSMDVSRGKNVVAADGLYGRSVLRSSEQLDMAGNQQGATGAEQLRAPVHDSSPLTSQLHWLAEGARAWRGRGGTSTLTRQEAEGSRKEPSPPSTPANGTPTNGTPITVTTTNGTPITVTTTNATPITVTTTNATPITGTPTNGTTTNATPTNGTTANGTPTNGTTAKATPITVTTTNGTTTNDTPTNGTPTNGTATNGLNDNISSTSASSNHWSFPMPFSPSDFSFTYSLTKKHGIASLEELLSQYERDASTTHTVTPFMALLCDDMGVNLPSNVTKPPFQLMSSLVRTCISAPSTPDRRSTADAPSTPDRQPTADAASTADGQWTTDMPPPALPVPISTSNTSMEYEKCCIELDAPATEEPEKMTSFFGIELSNPIASPLCQKEGHSPVVEESTPVAAVPEKENELVPKDSPMPFQQKLEQAAKFSMATPSLKTARDQGKNKAVSQQATQPLEMIVEGGGSSSNSSSSKETVEEPEPVSTRSTQRSAQRSTKRISVNNCEGGNKVPGSSLSGSKPGPTVPEPKKIRTEQQDANRTPSKVSASRSTSGETTADFNGWHTPESLKEALVDIDRNLAVLRKKATEEENNKKSKSEQKLNNMRLKQQVRRKRRHMLSYKDLDKDLDRMKERDAEQRVVDQRVVDMLESVVQSNARAERQTRDSSNAKHAKEDTRTVAKRRGTRADATRACPWVTGSQSYTSSAIDSSSPAKKRRSEPARAARKSGGKDERDSRGKDARESRRKDARENGPSHGVLHEPSTAFIVVISDDEEVEQGEEVFEF